MQVDPKRRTPDDDAGISALCAHAAALGFGVLIMIVGGMLILPCLFISPFRFLPDNFFITLLAICCGFIARPYCLFLAVTKLGSWLAAKTPLSCSVSAGLLPLLIATPALAFLPAGLGVTRYLRVLHV